MTSAAHPKAAFAVRAAFLFGLAVCTPSWAFFEDEEARRAILDLRTRVEVLGTRIGDLERQLQTSSQGQLQMLNENERLRSEISRLRGELEESSRAVNTGKKQQRDQIGVLEERLKQIGTLEERLKQIEPVTIDIDGVKHSVSPTEAAAFEKLQNTLRSGDFTNAASQATNFQTAYPTSSLAANALFIRGTALYALKDYKSSIAARLELLNKFASHPSAPPAMLNLAASQAETGNPNTSRATLENLIKTYPNSAAAAEARERLKAPPPKAPPPANKAPNPPVKAAPAAPAPKGPAASK